MILDTFRTATVNAAGVATVTIPVPRQEHWRLTRYTVLTNQAVALTTMPVATIYLDSVSDGNAVDTTYTGARDSGDCDLDLPGGHSIVCQWTGGIAGTIATLSINGSRDNV